MIPGGAQSTAPEASPGGRSVRAEDAEAALDHVAELIARSPHNLVARGERDRLRATHIRECEAVGELLAPAAGSRWLDLGTGGGLPGLILAIRFPKVSWTLLDATGKKVQMVRSFIDTLGISNAHALHGRAELLGLEAAYSGTYDGVVSRAVARLSVVLELSRPFLRDDGLLAVIKGPRIDQEIAEAERVRRLLRLGAIHRQVVAGTERPTTLVTMRAQGPPPRRRPRRPGISAEAPRGGRAR